MVSTHGATNDPINPAPQGVWLLYGVETRVNDHEHFLNDVVDGPVLDAEAPNRRPDEIEVGLIERRECGQGVGRRVEPEARLSRRDRCSRRRVATGHLQLLTQWASRTAPVKKSAPPRARPRAHPSQHHEGSVVASGEMRGILGILTSVISGARAKNRRPPSQRGTPAAIRTARRTFLMKPRTIQKVRSLLLQRERPWRKTQSLQRGEGVSAQDIGSYVTACPFRCRHEPNP
jgi:hypothetical protein